MCACRLGSSGDSPNKTGVTGRQGILGAVGRCAKVHWVRGPRLRAGLPRPWSTLCLPHLSLLSPQGLTGPIGPPGPAGANGEKVSSSLWPASPASPSSPAKGCCLSSSLNNWHPAAHWGL